MRKNKRATFKHMAYEFYNKTSYAYKPFLCLVIIVLLSWLGTQILGMFVDIQYYTYPEIAFDSQIPVVSEFVWIYYLTFPLAIITFFYVAYKDHKNLHNIALAMCICFAISGIFYLFANVEFIKPDDFVPTSISDYILSWTWGVTNVNCFPSQHCYYACIIIIACIICKDMKLWYRIFGVVCGVLITLATVFLRQHYLLDSVASYVIVIVVFGIVYLCKYGEKMVKRDKVREEKKREKKIEKSIKRVFEEDICEENSGRKCRRKLKSKKVLKCHFKE